jgi:hypothetical protein
MKNKKFITKNKDKKEKMQQQFLNEVDFPYRIFYLDK